MNTHQQVDFARLAEQVRQPRVGKAELSVWGGQCVELNVLAFLDGWPLAQMPFRIWEYPGEIVFDRDSLPRSVALLERGRLFGESGDLELRRSGAGFRWRFVGASGIQPPSGDYEARNYWADGTHEQATLCKGEGTVLLWGTRNSDGRWRANRVAAAKLNYPATGARLQLHYRTYSRAGQVAFVWFTGLSAWANGHQQDGHEQEGEHVEV